MSDQSKKPPQDLTLSDLTQEEMEMVKNWNLPDVEDEFKPKGKKATALGRSVDWYYAGKQKEVAQEQEPEEQFEPLTAEEIEEIRKAAYEEGLLQGHQEGFDKGHGEGVEKGYADGVEKGHPVGVERGLVEGRQVIDGQAARWQALSDQLANPLHQLDLQVEKQMVELSLMLAQAVVGVEILTNHEVIFQTLKESIDALPYGEKSCEISLNPLDVELVIAHFGEKEISERGWHIKSDAVIEQGGCLVESRTSSIDRTIKSRMESTLSRFIADSGMEDGNV